MKQISKNIDDKTQTSQAEYYTLLNLIKNIPEIKKIRKRPCIKFRNIKIRIKILLTEIYTTSLERYSRLGTGTGVIYPI